MSYVKSVSKAVTHLFLLCVIGISTSLPAQAASATPEEAIAAIVSAWVKEWNAHDANALGQLFTPNADFVGVSGALLKGRGEFSRVHREQFAGRYDKSLFAVTVAPDITFIKPDVALVHWRWSLAEVRTVDGTPIAPFRGIFTWIVTLEDGVWKIRASQNTIGQ